MRGSINLVKQAQQMQKKLLETQAALAEEVVEGSAGGGMVTVQMNGHQKVLDIAIDPAVVDPEDVDMLQDLILAALNEAQEKAQELAAERMGAVTGGLKIPGLT
ncbi:MAG: YbaB/EbfC family nucleoid-associated protein [Chloroflexi bacterium]|nr:YbaB/EbfC family nucleoid-associated protein [Chloroflexota bacterium]MBU1748420.1 YbaB/EbfC family nucleoid-associated protein [Chloroflexota bacterium]